MVFEYNLERLMFGIKSPSKTFERLGKCMVKGFKKGMILAEKEFKKYKKALRKFERKWNKQNEDWRECRHKRKARAKAFVKAFPEYSFHIEVERMGQQCKKY